MTARTRNCERCWVKGRNITPAMYHIDDQDLCRPCAIAEGYDLSQYTPLEQPKPVETAAQTSAQVPVLTNDVLGVARRRRQAAEKVERTRVKSEPLRKRAKPAEKKAPEPKACAYDKCGKQFVPKTSRQYFCSRECYFNDYWAKHPRGPQKLEPRRCADPNCGQEFEPRQKNSHFCSHRCYQRNWYQRTHDVKKPRIVGPVLGPKQCEAEGCGKEFVPSTAAARFCSQTCYQRDFKRRKAAQHRLEPRQCAAPACGQSFQPKRKDQRFCSDACKSAEHYARRKRAAQPPKQVPTTTKSGGSSSPSGSSGDASAPGSTPEGQSPVTPSSSHGSRQQSTPAVEKGPRESAAQPSGSNEDPLFKGGTVSIRVSEAALDRFWASLPVAKKAAIFER